MSAKPSKQFRFCKTDNIGAPGAEEDAEFLNSCFVETGDLELLSNPEDRHVIILGRTGTGKTALIHKLKTTDGARVIEIKPENLALTYIANSNVLNFFTELGINLDPFYKLLWRHVFTVEILTRFFDQHPVGDNSPTIYDRLRTLFSHSNREDSDLRQSIDYLEEWGKSFWSETEFRIKEITQKVENDLQQSLKATIGTDVLHVGGELSKGKKLSEEQRAEVINRGQEVVSKTQVRDLHQVFSLLDKVLSDKQKTYYIVIDGLDANWVEERLRYKLIMGLIMTAREFIPVSHAKIVIALRRDLIERVFRRTRESGFQEEKYQGLYLPLSWSKQQILEVLDSRVRKLVRRRYTKKPVGYKDLLPKTYRGESLGEYIYSIADRPRDVIALFNICVLVAIDKSGLSETEFTKAVAEYSRARLRALADEWHADYPDLVDFTELLSGRTTSFKIHTVRSAHVVDLCLNIVSDIPGGKGILHSSARGVVDELIKPEDFRKTLFQCFYHIGLVGLKTSADMAESWVDDTGQAVTRRQIDSNTSVVIAPKYVVAVGIDMRS
ncbi:hypothetical protein Mal52_44820 [Symmachiella dynata]|uniref:DNA repair ATPase n=1 Tax=Symmachiella dynata TaxID=2527995 RepID=A0A517ZU68_9PLAN|nr:ATP-binding protein [Symmachiella dynata]QDU45985.1 hypothetical protein Mal52_44820 [Symmachiella dynata]